MCCYGPLRWKTSASSIRSSCTKRGQRPRPGARAAGWDTVTAADSVLYHQLGATAGSSRPSSTETGADKDTSVVALVAVCSSQRWGRVRRFQRPKHRHRRALGQGVGRHQGGAPRTLASRLGGLDGDESAEHPPRLEGWKPVPQTDRTRPAVAGARWAHGGVRRRHRHPGVPLRAGIQRAVSELVTRLILEHPEVSVVPMRWSALDRCYRRLDGAETEALFDPEAMPNHPPAAAAADPPRRRHHPGGRGPRRSGTHRRGATAASPPPTTTASRRPAHRRILAGATLLDLDATWNLDDAPRSRWYPQAESSPGCG